MLAIQEVSPQASPARILSDSLRARIEKNPAYSLRAFARDLGVSHTFVSLVLSGKKPLSVERATQIAGVLDFTRAETRRFVRSVVIASPAKRGAYGYLKSVLSKEEEPKRPSGRIEFLELEQDRFRAMTGWWHFAVLDLMTCVDARSDAVWIARRLGITTGAAREAVERLLRLGLLEEQGGKWIKTRRHLVAEPGHADTMMRLFHKGMIAQAMQTVTNEDGPEAARRRDLLSMTVAINPARLERARELVTEFQKKIVECLTEDPCTDVYQFNVQLLPLTRPRKESP